MGSSRSTVRVWRNAALLALPVAIVFGALPATAQPGEPGPAPQPAASRGNAGDPNGVALVRVFAANQDAVNNLAARFDVTEYTKPLDDGRIEVHVVATPEELDEIRAAGYEVAGSIFDQTDAAKNIAQRNATMRLNALMAASTDKLTVLRAEWFSSIPNGQKFLNIEVKSDDTASNTALTVTWAGGSANMARFVDASQYMYHRFTNPVALNAAPPTEVTITSNKGGTITVPVKQWLGAPKPAPDPTYAKDFVDHYMDPTELYARINALHNEFPAITEIINMPYKTNGYRRAAQAQFGTATNARFFVTSKAYGSEGGNNISVTLQNPGFTLTSTIVSVEGNDIVVALARNSAGNITATAKQVVDAINASDDAKALVTAALVGTDTGGTAVAAAGKTMLTDNLKAPASVSRQPFQMQVLRIGKVRDGSKPGVFMYSQEHAREWVTPLVAIEASERLLRNYATDANTRALVDDLDIFVVPSMNPDGSHYSFYDYNSQRRNMTNYCPTSTSQPGNRNSWGVDLNRNFSVGTTWDGYNGGGTSCTSDTFSGPSALSEPEAKNEVWLTKEYPNIKFAMNTHSYGGYFMWPPGAYKTAGRVTLPRIDLGTEQFFWAASDHILNAVQAHRGTAIWPGRTGPVIDVLYSAAGNSADEHWYNRGIIGWDFEVGADIYNPTTKNFTAVGFQPAWAEAHEEALEFANGWIGILEVARSYALDKVTPRSTLSITGRDATSTSFTFSSDKPSNIYYTLDGSRPTLSSNKLTLAGMREGASSITVNSSTEVKWFSVDIAGNVENGYNPDPALNTANYRHTFVGVGAGSDGLETITAQAVGGPLTMQVSNSLVSLPNVTLTGADQLISGALNAVKVLDGRGTAGGWNLTGQVSDFVGPNGVIVADNLGWAPTAKVLPGSLPTLASEQPSVAAGSSVTAGSGGGLRDARGLCSSPSGASAGSFECGGGLTLGVPGSARLGTYTGVLTLTLV